MVTHIAAYYEVRRQAWEPGVFQDERAYPPGFFAAETRELARTVPWSPVGTLAVRTVRELERVAGGASPPPRMLRDVARVAAGTLERSAWERRWTHQWRPPEGMEVSAALGALARASFWRAVIAWQQGGSPEFVRRFPGQLLPFVQKLDAIGDTIRFRGVRTPRLKGRRRTETALRFSVLGDQAGAVYLSVAFGILAGRLRICVRCEAPFITDLTRPNQRICGNCRGGARTGPPRLYRRVPMRLRPLDARIRKRLDTRVSRGTLSSQDRRQTLLKMAWDSRRVQAGDMTISQWQKQWDTTQDRGRPPKRAPADQRLDRGAHGHRIRNPGGEGNGQTGQAE